MDPTNSQEQATGNPGLHSSSFGSTPGQRGPTLHICQAFQRVQDLTYSLSRAVAARVTEVSDMPNDFRTEYFMLRTVMDALFIFLTKFKKAIERYEQVAIERGVRPEMDNGECEVCRVGDIRSVLLHALHLGNSAFLDLMTFPADIETMREYGKTITLFKYGFLIQKFLSATSLLDPM